MPIWPRNKLPLKCLEWHQKFCVVVLLRPNIFVCFVCIFTYLCVQMSVCTHLCVNFWKPEVNIRYFPQCLSALDSETESLTEPEAYWLGWTCWAETPRVHLSLPCQYWDYRGRMFYMGYGVPNAGPRACEAITLTLDWAIFPALHVYCVSLPHL